jgi:glycosyltransferase involved in cell wall biosynthesis
MRILLDNQVFSWQKYGGISSLWMELYKHLKTKGVEIDMPIKYSFNGYLAENADMFPHAQIISPKQYDQTLPFKFNFRGRSRLQNWRAFGVQNVAAENNASILGALDTGLYDIFHSTYFDPYFLQRLGPPTPGSSGRIPKFVMSIYDVIPELYPELFADANDPQREGRQKMIARADHITVISEAVKKDVIDVYGVDPDKISVVYLASNLTEVEPEPNRLEKDDYLLYVGDRTKYKDWGFLIAAIAQVLKSKNIKLINVGGGAFTSEERELISQLGLKNLVVHRGGPTSAQIAAYFRDARALLYPSYAEGFGIPVVEAMHFGTPVIASDASCLPEIAGDAALLLPPKQASAWADGVASLLDNASLAQTLSEKGRVRALDFSYAKSAEQLIQVYQRLI